MLVKRSLVLTLAALLGLASTSWAIDKQRIKKAVDAGVKFIKQSQNRTAGNWSYIDVQQESRPAYACGMTSLAGLTLLVCNVPANDPAVQKAATYIRNGADGVIDTYSLSLCVMFLDKLGDHNDEALIQGLAQRIIQGQKPDGAWSYRCPHLPLQQTRRLENQDKTHDQARPRGQSGPPANASEVARRQWEERAKHGQPPQGWGGWPPQSGGPFPANVPTTRMEMAGDNSNTQFATMALWIARRHDVKVDDSLTRVSSYFRATQNLDGGWAYLPSNHGNSTPSMTCAGLIGLAVGKGLKGKDANHGKAKYDSRVSRALGRLGQQDVGRPVGNRRGVPPPIIRQDIIGIYYFLWSLERTAMIYSLKSFHKKDWYAWGAELLVFNQREDGSWRGKYGESGPADTCFALMFLMRSNLVDDLTRTLYGPTGAVERALRPHGMIGDEGPTADSDDGIADAGHGSTAPRPRSPRPASGPDKTGLSPRPTPAGLDTSSSPLATRLVSSPFDQRSTVLAEYRDGKGGKYTEALAGAIHVLNGDLREQVRDALAERLARMTAGTLRNKLKDDDTEVRSAAALACAMKREQTLIPDLIQAIKDTDSRVPQAARVALKNLTGADFGPAPTATRAERAAVAEKWQRWWQQHKDELGGGTD